MAWHGTVEPGQNINLTSCHVREVRKKSYIFISLSNKLFRHLGNLNKIHFSVLSCRWAWITEKMIRARVLNLRERRCSTKKQRPSFYRSTRSFFSLPSLYFFVLHLLLSPFFVCAFFYIYHVYTFCQCKSVCTCIHKEHQSQCTKSLTNQVLLASYPFFHHTAYWKVLFSVETLVVPAQSRTLKTKCFYCAHTHTQVHSQTQRW